MEKIIRIIDEHIILVHNSLYNKLCIRKNLSNMGTHCYDTLYRYNIPHLPQVLELAETSVLLQYFEGETLDTYFAAQKPLDSALFCSMLLSICEALIALHKNNLVCCGIDLQHIIITKKKEFYLTNLDAIRPLLTEEDKYADIEALGKIIEQCVKERVDAALFTEIIAKTTTTDTTHRYSDVFTLRADVKQLMESITGKQINTDQRKVASKIVVAGIIAKIQLTLIKVIDNIKLRNQDLPRYDKIISTIVYIMLGVIGVFVSFAYIRALIKQEIIFSFLSVLLLIGITVSVTTFIPTLFLIIPTLILKVMQKKTMLLRLLIICAGLHAGGIVFAFIIGLIAIIFGVELLV